MVSSNQNTRFMLVFCHDIEQITAAMSTLRIVKPKQNVITLFTINAN